jgi:hypothetical protein
MNDVPETSGTLLRSIICCCQREVGRMVAGSSLSVVGRTLAARMSACATSILKVCLTRRFLGTAIVSV